MRGCPEAYRGKNERGKLGNTKASFTRTWVFLKESIFLDILKNLEENSGDLPSLVSKYGCKFDDTEGWTD